MGQLMLFDYATLDAETRIVVQQRTGEIKTLMRRAAQDIVDIGLKLIEVKGRLPHGAFLPWVASEFGWHRDTVNKFMHVAERYGAIEMSKLSTFAPSALYLLAAPSTPEEARVEAMERAESGEAITHAKAREIIGGKRPDPPPAPTPATADFCCPDCGELFSEEVWHCRKCAHHWQMHRTECWNCQRPRPGFEGDDEEDDEDGFGDAQQPPSPMPKPVPIAPPPPRYPHSDRIRRWLEMVASETLVIRVEMGGIAALLGERDKWHRPDVQDFVLPMLDALSQTVAEFRKEIADAFDKV